MAYAEPWLRPLFGGGVRAATGRGDGRGETPDGGIALVMAGYGGTVRMSDPSSKGHSGEPGRQRGR